MKWLNRRILDANQGGSFTLCSLKLTSRGAASRHCSAQTPVPERKSPVSPQIGVGICLRIPTLCHSTEPNRLRASCTSAAARLNRIEAENGVSSHNLHQPQREPFLGVGVVKPIAS
uniref:Uncharacterized protein n=1 Tax=Coccidioides posadasii RMSCC 3488 TaxID=454284 RepID=A0A0J6I709_COCPO|nr:hypothetical protein CPAG_03557 [Coccidioides posadasii RMSCC 3488]